MKSKLIGGLGAQAPPGEAVEWISISELHPFPNHPYGVRDDPAMLNTVSSILVYFLSPKYGAAHVITSTLNHSFFRIRTGISESSLKTVMFF